MSFSACHCPLLFLWCVYSMWRRFCLQRTDAFTALEVTRRCTIWIDFLLTEVTYVMMWFFRSSHNQSSGLPVLVLKAVPVATTRSSSASKTSRWLSVIVLISFHLLVSYGICVQMRCIVATSLLLCPVIYTYNIIKRVSMCIVFRF